MTKWMEIDYDYLRTGTAIGFRASRELCSNYLLVLHPSSNRWHSEIDDCLEDKREDYYNCHHC